MHDVMNSFAIAICAQYSNLWPAILLSHCSLLYCYTTAACSTTTPLQPALLLCHQGPHYCYTTVTCSTAIPPQHALLLCHCGPLYCYATGIEGEYVNLCTLCIYDNWSLHHKYMNLWYGEDMWKINTQFICMTPGQNLCMAAFSAHPGEGICTLGVEAIQGQGPHALCYCRIPLLCNPRHNALWSTDVLHNTCRAHQGPQSAPPGGCLHLDSLEAGCF